MAWMQEGHGRRAKVFCFFSSEKKSLPSFQFNGKSTVGRDI
jgi:hypothetical protein